MPTAHKYTTKSNTAGSILFNLTKAGKTVSVKTYQDALKKAGRKVTNLPNRLYWFGRSVESLGFDLEVNDEKQTLRLVKRAKNAPKSGVSKPAPKAKKAKKAARKAVAKHAVKVTANAESESVDETQE